MGGDGPQLPLGQFDGQVDDPGVAGVYYQTIRFAVGADRVAAHQQSPDFFDGPLGRGQSNAGDRVLRQGAEPLYGQG